MLIVSERMENYFFGGNIMLKTNLKHLVSEKELNELISSNENVMIC